MKNTTQDEKLNQDRSFEKLISKSPEVKPTELDTKNVYKKKHLSTDFLLKNAKILLAANDTALAKNIFYTLIDRGELLSSAYTGLATCWEREGQEALAIKAYKEALVYEASYASLISLSNLLMKKKKYQDSIKALLRALYLPKNTKKEFFEIHELLGNCYLHEENLDYAENHYKKAHHLFKLSSSIHINLGCVALKRNKANLALVHFKESLKIKNENPTAHTCIGLAQLILDEKKSAHDSFFNALIIKNNNKIALYHLIKISYELQLYNRAIQILLKFISENPINSAILFNLSGLYFKKGDLKKSKEYCEKLLEINPQYENGKKLLIQIKEKEINYARL